MNKIKFINNCRLTHTMGYDYSRVNENINTQSKEYVEIGCPNCNTFFKVRYDQFQKGSNCPNCTKTGRKPKEKVIKIPKTQKKSKYDLNINSKFSLALVNDNISAEEEIVVICRDCSRLFTTSRRILQKANYCPYCRVKKKPRAFEEYVNKAREVHGNHYSYFKEFYNKDKKLLIRCNWCHNVFWQPLSRHLAGGGCITCGIKKRTEHLSLTEEVIKDRIAKEAKSLFKFHMDNYNRKSIIYFHCNKHNIDFKQSYDSFETNNICCPMEKVKSLGEKKVFDYLEENGYKYGEDFIDQHSSDGLIDSSLLKIDFFFPKLGIVLEINGIQHEKWIPQFQATPHDFHRQKHHDWLKRKFARDNGYRYEEIWYNENLEEKLKTILK